MSESIDTALKKWVSEAKPLVGQPLDSPGGSAKDKWAELEKIISPNLKGLMIGDKTWEDAKKLINEAIANRELNPSDLSPKGDPMQKAITMSNTIVAKRELRSRAEAIGVKSAGVKTLVSSKTGKADVTELEKIVTAWQASQKMVDEYVKSGFNVEADPVYQKALERAPTAGAFDKEIAVANVAGARALADDHASWWTQTRSALNKATRLKQDYGPGTQHIDPETWLSVATLANEIDRLNKEISDELKKAGSNVGSGKSTVTKNSVDAAERSLKRAMDAWNKVKVESIYEKEEAGKTAKDELTDLLIEAQELAVVEPPLSANPLYATLTSHMGDRYDYFASQKDSWDRLNNRGVDCVPDVSDFLRTNFKLGMGIRVGGRVYTVCASNTSSAGLAFHTPIPAKLLIPQRPNVQSFVYHF